MSAELEAEVRRLCEAGELHAAAEHAVTGYGPELLGFLHGALGNEADAHDVFSQTTEDLWSGLPRFEWRSSLRTWLYVLGRHAAARHRRSPHRRRDRQVPLSAAEEVAERVRTRTAAHLRTQVKDGFARLRDALEEEDRMLLILRVDRGLSWDDVARVLGGELAADDDLSRATARLRKRFQLLKQELRERAKAAGLVGEDDGA